MKIALQLGLIPAKTTVDKAKWAADHGVAAIELGVFGVSNAELRQQADDINGLVAISSVCANAAPDGTPLFDFIDADKAKRRASIDGSKEILKFCGEVGATGQIAPPIFGGPVVPDLSPAFTIAQLEDALMLEACRELGSFAAEHKTLWMLEPLNRYEQHYLRTQADGMRIMDEAAVAGIGLLSDFFHMNIEETDSPAAFAAAKNHTTAIHLADNTRQEPGVGDIDFVASFKVLKANGYDGYMAYECGISGNDDKEKAANLAKSLDYVRSCIDKA